MTSDGNDKPRLKLPIDTWPIICCGTIFAALFFLFGIDQLIASYSSTDPYSFLMLFFSSSMIILVNGTILFVLLVLGLRKFRNHKDPENRQNQPIDDNDG